MGTEEQNLTPEQQQSKDASQIQTTFSATDRLERFSAQFSRMGFGTGSGPGGFFGKTNFENAPLNAMLDLLEAANPAELEAAGTALEAARKALNDAARDLKKDAAAVDLKGVAGTEFQRFASDLATYTYNLASFANIVGAQMKVASTGLASVRNARPPRDTRPDPKKPTDFPPAERTADNEDYQKALKAESDRQEAINQLNRLASFYAVSESTLAAQEPPKFPERLKAAVPPPSNREAVGEASGARAAMPSGAHHGSGAEAPQGAYGGERGGTPTPPRSQVLGPTPPPSMPDPSMQIDTIAPPAPPVTAPPTPTPTPTVPTTSTGPFTPPPVAPGLPTTGKGPVTGRNPVAPAGPRTTGPTTSQYGRPGVPGGPQVGQGGPGQTGRTGTPGQASPVGRPGGPGTPGTPAAGRQNVIGGPGTNPMVGRPGSPGAPTTGRTGGSGSPVAGRATTGIVGGTPQQRPATGGGAAVSRIPTGTVIGGQSAAQGRPSAARPATGGVIGANPGAAARSTGRGTPSVNGVVGTPRSQRAKGQKDEEQPGSERPDYLVEDEETWATRRRGAVPPVID